jgi:multimeric flavodoxin WrbA
MNILGIAGGKKMGQTEIFVKEALMGAEEVGAEVKFVRLLDLNIKPCSGCNVCVIKMFGGQALACPIKDDMRFLDELLLESDGVIAGAPIFEKSPPGYFKDVNDRMGPSHDLAMLKACEKVREENNVTDGDPVDERFFKPRVSGLIAIGGSEWTTLALPLMQMFVQPMGITPVDKVVFQWSGLSGTAALMDDKLQRVRKMGRHVAECAKNPAAEPTYVGNPGMCSVCHSSTLEIEGNADDAVCAVCGVHGALKIEGDTIRMEVGEEEKVRSHVLMSGKEIHDQDLRSLLTRLPPNMDELPQRLEKYKNYLSYSKPAK